ncbi:IclR family transcriptional regulator [Maledivibacter halophilus]|uniref:Transcriptional regulator, IclR family n=1 Tax=Maledivibacter halophilus TaxID=36842 RepID=A0A1T5LXZ0_9FIRM|nr:IclR family transcriptional regulator [Maledivibacter halophilus]SKC80831.1 transcriptional regulator, IclR family [Maledivibacter halophilus]
MSENSKNIKGKKTINSVTKAIEIMEFIAYSDEEVGVTEISNSLNYGVSATYHLLNTLRKVNIIEQNPKTKKYRLGIKLWQIGKIANEQNRLSLILKPYLKKLKNLTEETSNLTVLDNNEIVYLAQEESDRLVKMFTKTGARAPLYCSAAGKILLAYQSPEKQKTILESLNLKKFTDKTIIDINTLKNELNKIKNNGYGFDHEERELGVSCIAAPVLGFNDEIIAAISISGPTSRFNEENTGKWIEYILEITNEASKYFKNK